jgi:hypothetical protein
MATTRALCEAAAMRRLAIVLLCGGLLGLGSVRLPAAPTASSTPASGPGFVADFDPAPCLLGPADQSERFAAELERLTAPIATTDNPLDRAAGHLAVANWLVSVPTARTATRWLLGFQNGDDLRSIAGYARQAREHLDRARAILKADKPNGDKPGKRHSELERTADTLAAFIDLFAVAGVPAGDAKAKSAFADAALGLSVARESDDPDLSACALLWQSFAWDCAGRRERSLASLPNALNRPDQASFDFLGRLLRCRLTAEDGRRTAAFALLIRVRGLCNPWFDQESTEALAARRRLVAALQYRVGQACLEQSAASGSPAVTADIKTMLGDLRGLLVDRGRCGEVYVLPRAVPILAESPARPARAPAGSAPTTSSAAP